MYCVIQEIQLKKPNSFGAYKELEAYSVSVNGKDIYAYNYTGGRFERPIKTAYKISIHESKRINGVVTKKQYAVTTVSYYDLVEFWIGDCFLEKKLQVIADNLNTTVDTLWTLINNKVDPLQQRIKAEFEKTVEYKTHAKHQRIIKKHISAKSKFAKDYNVSENEYDCCYNVFGNVVNQAYLDEIIKAAKQRRSYYKQSSGNYSGSSSGYDYSSFFPKISNSYTNTDKEYLKKFYKTLAMKFHPDVNRGADTTEEMKLLNKLKDDWGV